MTMTVLASLASIASHLIDKWLTFQDKEQKLVTKIVKPRCGGEMRNSQRKKESAIWRGKTQALSIDPPREHLTN